MAASTPSMPVATPRAKFEAALFTDLARLAMKRAQALNHGDVLPDRGTVALALICASTIEEADNLGLERSSDHTDNLLDLMGLLARRDQR